MSENSIVVDTLAPAGLERGRYSSTFPSRVGEAADHSLTAGAALAANITRRASTQTYYTIHLLADRPLVADAYRAYAYFRWLDDRLDQESLARPDRLAFLARQQALVASAYRENQWPGPLAPEERLVVDLIQSDDSADPRDSGLRSYIDNMMAVMAFDADRRGRLISQVELDDYTRWLATAVTEALHYFIGHGEFSPHDETRYLAVTAAHITHMLRDAIEDAAVGYYNIPGDYLQAHGIGPADVGHDAYLAWVRDRVQLARDDFRVGKEYLSRVENLRCRIAGHAYVARFEVVLDAIEKDGYRLRAAYPERKRPAAGLRMAWSALSGAFISRKRTYPVNPLRPVQLQRRLADE